MKVKNWKGEDAGDWDPAAAERADWLERIARWQARLDASEDRTAELTRAMLELAAEDAKGYGSPEVFHPEADALLLAYVPEAAREAFLSRRRWYA